VDYGIVRIASERGLLTLIAANAESLQISVDDAKLLTPTQRKKALRRRLSQRPSDRLQASCRPEHRPRWLSY